jgi:RluA family pseudouridine synthase
LPSILYQDDALLVINKSAGLLSIPDGYDPDLPHLRTLLEPVYGPLWIVHRLDKDTSGALVLARDAEAHRVLNRLFRERQIRKIYHGLVAPVPDWQTQTMDLPLQVDADRKHRTRADPTQGKPARTEFKVLKRFPYAALLEITIETGITHQIRAHLRSLELALLGDALYQAGLPAPPVAVERTMLHARELSFPHPNSGARLTVTAPYSDDFREVYTDLRFTKDQEIWP